MTAAARQTDHTTSYGPLRPGPTDTSDQRDTDAVGALRALLETAARLDVDDELAWTRLGAMAHDTTAALATAGALPAHLTVGADDPPVLVTRTLVAAWRRATSPPRRPRPRG